ncbi:MAG: hypothetical protein KFF73_12270 [Cyclobacteriaceae bacterium]|nr:hypothetical protein [Cyclobacteriaceae bacterium]
MRVAHLFTGSLDEWAHGHDKNRGLRIYWQKKMSDWVIASGFSLWVASGFQPTPAPFSIELSAFSTFGPRASSFEF